MQVGLTGGNCFLIIFSPHLSSLLLCAQIKYTLPKKLWKRATCCVFRTNLSKCSGTICIGDILHTELSLIFWKFLGPGQWPYKCFSMYISFVLEAPVFHHYLTCEGLHHLFLFFLKIIMKEESCILSVNSGMIQLQFIPTSHILKGEMKMWSREGRESECLRELGNGAGPLSLPSSSASILPRSHRAGEELPCDGSFTHLWEPVASGPFLGDRCQNLESLRLSSLTLCLSG